MKILVLGAGAMGSLYGGLLKERGNDVTLVDVFKDHIDEINKNGLEVELLGVKKNIKVEACTSDKVDFRPDLVILFTKTIHSRSALDSIHRIIDDNTLVLSLQNGLGNDEIIREYVRAENIIIGTTNFPSDFISPGKIRSNGTGQTKIMTSIGYETSELKEVQSALDNAGFNCIITKDVFVSIWEKVAFNSACNALTAITKLKLGDVGKTEEGKILAHRIVQEVSSVANKKGIKASADNVIELVEADFIEHYEHIPSMAQDVLTKRLTEIQFINGAVVKEAEELGMYIPVTETLYQLISIVQSNYENILK
ncbi:ketopantoate reductase family protein [Gudongella sp. DL1XJH-153]|uniref:ketopantoate reductase family protein n=1 Tax=Gudongella sp. DL1XJH-153 TaxID=3409804 RepID=UPI003BB5E3C7